MKDKRSNRMILGGVVGVLLLAVLADRLGLIPSASADESEDVATSAAQRYLNERRQLDEEQALLATRKEVDKALAAVREEWSKATQTLAHGQTAELAEAAFRERVLATAGDLGLRSVSASAVRDGTSVDSKRPAALSSLRPIALRLQFDTERPAEVYRLVDALENLPDVRTSVDSVSIAGPGMVQVGSQVTATIVVRAMALVGESGA